MVDFFCQMMYNERYNFLNERLIVMRSRFFSFIVSAAVLAGIFFTLPAVRSGFGTGFYLNAEAKEGGSDISAPKADKKSDYYLLDSEYLKVTLSCETEGAVIYYKLNNGEYKEYTKPVGITRDSVLSAYAVLGKKKSSAAKYEYKLGAKYKLSAKPGDYTGDKTIKVTTNVPDVKFYYTLDGKQANEKSAEFPEGGLKIRNSATLSIYAAKKGWTGSVGSYTYSINKLYNYKYYYHYSKLSDKGKKAYERILEAVEKGKEKAYLEDIGIKNDELTKVVYAFDKDVYRFAGRDTYVSWCHWTADAETGKCLELFTDYDRYSPKVQSQQQKFEVAAEKAAAEAQKQPTAYGKIKYIHDWLIDNTEYASYMKNYDSKFIDSPFVKGVGNCIGYSAAFHYLAQSLGFDCIVVTGYSSRGENGTHAWNKIRLDGAWYNIDVTWDDGKEKGAKYDYFLKSDKTFSKNHTENDLLGGIFTYPAAPEDYR